MKRIVPRLPLDPLLALYDNRLALARALKVDARQIQRWCRYGVAFYTADELAVSLGFHPMELWPRWVEVGEELPDDGTPTARSDEGQDERRAQRQPRRPLSSPRRTAAPHP